MMMLELGPRGKHQPTNKRVVCSPELEIGMIRKRKLMLRIHEEATDLMLNHSCNRTMTLGRKVPLHHHRIIIPIMKGREDP